MPLAGSNMLAYRVVDDTARFLMVSKSPGWLTHGGVADECLLRVLKRDFHTQALYPVHRLDEATSGLLIVAKDKAALSELSKAFEAREIEKYYIALSHKKAKKKQGLLEGDLLPGRNGCYKLSTGLRQPSRTAWFSFPLVPGRRLLVLKPFTGKTHQLRVVSKSLSCPILGDARYGGLPADRMYLHAYSLGFRFEGVECRYTDMPSEGEYFTDPVFVQAMSDLGAPEKLQWPSGNSKRTYFPR